MVEFAPVQNRKSVRTFAASHGVQFSGAFDTAEAVLVITAQPCHHLLGLENL